MLKINEFTWKIGGPAGFGIMSVGLIFSKIFSRAGYYVVDGKEYPSLIQGGHNAYTVRISTDKIFSLLNSVNILVSLDENTINAHLDEVAKGGFIVYDKAIFKNKSFNFKKPGVNFIPVPFDDLIKEIGAPEIVKNNIALGLSVALVNYDFKILKEIIAESFARKGKEANLVYGVW